MYWGPDLWKKIIQLVVQIVQKFIKQRKYVIPNGDINNTGIGWNCNDKWFRTKIIYLYNAVHIFIML